MANELDELIKQLDIPSFFQAQGLVVGRKRKSWECQCPLCNDPKHFNLSPQTGLWICNKCGEKGNPITFYAKVHQCSNGDAVKAIKATLGIVDEPPKRARRQTRKAKDQTPQRPPDPPDTIKQIYKRFIELVPLTPEHRQELKDKRGFTDQTIDELFFRSGGKHVTQVIEKLKAEFKTEDIAGSGILVKVNNSYIVEQQLLQNIILIPYIDSNQYIYHLRPHKLGFANFPNQIYCPFLIKDISGFATSGHIILTEGEYKAAALRQWGLPGLAIPGISSFGKKNFDRLVNSLKKNQVTRVTVVFDNEIKDDPTLPNFKAKREARYDTQFWAYIIAYRLSHAGIEADVSQLPDSWREKGKIDFDGAMAQGRGRDEILPLYSNGQSPDDFLDSLPEEALRVVRRKKGRFFSEDLPVKREFNRYVITRHKQTGEPWEQSVSNFVLNIKSSFHTPEGVIRNVELINEYGERSEPFTLDPGEMAGVNEFKKFCFAKGNYIFEGKADDLLLVWKYEFLRDDGEVIYMPEQIGYLGKGLWLFGNMAIKKGEVFYPDSDGIIWVNGRGYKPQSMQVGSRGEPVENAIPSLCEQDIDIKDVANKLRDTIGGYEAYMGLGWVVATVFSNDIFERYKCMPFLFPHGKRESGKTTFMRWIMACFGVENEGITVADTTTANFIARVLSYYSSLGVWLDEYRNDPKVTAKDGFFRSAYNRQVSGKGTATSFQTKGFTVRATIAISGEELPKDNGLFTRLIPLQISANKRKTSESSHFEWLNRNCRNLSGFVRHLIINYETYLPKVLDYISGSKKLLVSRGITDRTAENWAICAGAFEAVIMEDDGFVLWIEDACQDIKETGEQEHMLNQFWDDVNYLYSEGTLGDKHLKVVDGKLYVWFKGCYEAWSVHYRKRSGKEPFDRISIIKYLQEEPYLVDLNISTRLGQGVKKAAVIDVSKSTDTIQELASNISDRYRQPEQA